MAEKIAGQSVFDDGGGKDVGEASKVSAKGNNRFQADTQALHELDTALTKINTNINKLKTDLPKVISLTEQWASKMRMVSNAMGGMGGGGGPVSPNGAPAGTLTQSVLGGGGGPMFHFGDIVTDRSQNLTMMGGGGGGKGPSAGDIGKQIASQVASAIGAALNNRINENSSYSLSANRMDMLLQQTSGMSRQGVYTAQRQPLQQYKLGAGGINSVLSLQASTGIDALKQAKSVESLRASSGYAYSTDQINQMTRGMASAQSANRMFMTMGTGMYGVGGQQKSSMTVVKDVVQRLGLTTESALKGAMAPGSMTRERLRQSGLPEDMQDLVLQYAQQNVAYKKKGGAGMYDASNKGMRKTMGVEDSYANQNEETTRVKGNREENMYKRQADNYAAMEKGMQSLTRTMEKLDNAMSGLVGAKIRTRGIGSIIKGALPMAGTLLGAAIGTAAGGNTVLGATLGSWAGNFGASMIGDATGEKESNAQKLNAKSSGTPANVTKSQGALSQLNPKMREKVKSMLAANPKLYIGGGVRSTAQQKAMFLDRYKPTTEKTDVFWKGQYWQRHKGAAAAPPGMSMHEIGLAVDFAPASEFDWVKEHAKDFGLRSFFDVNNEPWHVQPVELPASRIQYEKSGAPWGHNGQVSDPTDLKATINNLLGMEHQSVSSLGGQGAKSKVNIKIQDYSGMSINDAIDAMGPQGGGSRGGSGGSTGNVHTSSVGTPGTKGGGSKILSGSQVASVLYKAGFRGKRLVEAVAIAKRESGFNTESLRSNSTEYSLGLMQINMNKQWEKGRLKQYHLKTKEELYDPAKNAAAAWALSGHGNNWYHWGGYKGMNPLEGTDTKQAAKYVKQAGYATSGDPKQGDPVQGMGMGKNMPQQAPAASTVLIQQQPSMSSGTPGNNYNVTISPTIHLHGGNNTAMDAQKISREIAAHVERQMRLTTQRGR